MSGISTTLTIPCDADLGASLMEAWQGQGEIDLDDDLADGCLQGASRNNGMEWTLNRLVTALRLDGLRHLQAGFDPATGATLDDSPYATLLQPRELKPAADSLRRLCDLARRDPEALRRALADQAGLVPADQLRAAVADEPASVDEAIEAYDEASEQGDGTDFEALFAFVQARALVFDDAAEAGQCVLYVAWP